jgi:hypothetical protein
MVTGSDTGSKTWQNTRHELAPPDSGKFKCRVNNLSFLQNKTKRFELKQWKLWKKKTKEGNCGKGQLGAPHQIALAIKFQTQIYLFSVSQTTTIGKMTKS